MVRAVGAPQAPNEEIDVSGQLLQALGQGGTEGAGVMGRALISQATQEEEEDEEDHQPMLEVPTDPALIHAAVAPVTPNARVGITPAAAGAPTPTSQYTNPNHKSYHNATPTKRRGNSSSPDVYE